jgi:hypothetical protein
MAGRTQFRFATLGLAAIILAGVPAAARSVAGAMGPTSKADVQISVRVMPRFKFGTVPAEAGRPAIALTSNAPALRYDLATRPAAASPQAGDKRLLILVVPD